MNDAFLAAVEEVKNLRQKPNSGEMIELYGLYKQATVGDVNIDRPGVLKFAEVVKWDAWSKKKGICKDDAMVRYVELVEELKAKYGI